MKEREKNLLFRHYKAKRVFYDLKREEILKKTGFMKLYFERKLESFDGKLAAFLQIPDYKGKGA